MFGISHCDCWYALQWLLELVCCFAHEFQELAALVRLCTLLDRFELLNFSVFSALVSEFFVTLHFELRRCDFHEAVDVLEDQKLSRLVVG